MRSVTLFVIPTPTAPVVYVTQNRLSTGPPAPVAGTVFGPTVPLASCALVGPLTHSSTTWLDGDSTSNTMGNDTVRAAPPGPSSAEKLKLGVRSSTEAMSQRSVSTCSEPCGTTKPILGQLLTMPPMPPERRSQSLLVLVDCS